MKNFYLTGSIIFSVLVLIVGFQNLGSTFNGFTVLFTALDDLNGTLTVFGIAMLGAFTGAFYYGYILEIFKKRQEDEEQPGGMM